MNALIIDTGANAVTNSGTLEATGSGSATISGAATLEFGAASNQHVIFDAGAAGTLKLDAASDFSGSVSGFGDGDKLDLRDLLVGEHSDGSGANLADYLNFASTNSGADTVIQVSTHGGGAAGVDQTIVLQGVDMTTLTTLGTDDS